jgi:AcrR family transcriptional regulator
MDLDRKKALLESSLERAAEALGDVTPQVMAAYYQRHPEARQRFDELLPGGGRRLEQEMVEQALYCLMEWYNAPAEIEIILTNTVPHHAETLGVRPQLFSELIAAVCDTIAATIPAHEAGERAVWRELREEMQRLVDEGARFAHPPLQAAL